MSYFKKIITVSILSLSLFSFGKSFAQNVSMGYRTDGFAPILSETPCVNLQYDMKPGSRDYYIYGNVMKLQTFLYQNELMDYPPTGLYGESTFDGVKNFQSSMGLIPTGVIDSYTRDSLSKVTCKDTQSQPVKADPVVVTTPPVQTGNFQWGYNTGNYAPYTPVIIGGGGGSISTYFPVNYYSNNSLILTQSVPVNTLATKPADPTNGPAGQTFSGWYTDNNVFSNAFSFATTTINAATNLYANWSSNTSPCQPTLSSSGITSSSITFNWVASSTCGGVPTGYSYSINGVGTTTTSSLSTTTNNLISSTSYTINVAAYNSYGTSTYASLATSTLSSGSQQISFTVYYDANGGTGSPSVSSQVVTTSSFTTATIGTLASSTAQFNGWNTLANGSGTHYAAGTATSNITATTTLYAEWSQNPISFTITYDANGGTGSPSVSSQVVTTSSFTTATIGTLASSTAQFNGWNTLANGSGTHYAAGTATSNITATTTLYAEWSPLSPTNLYISNTDATANTPISQVTLNWTPVSNATGYEVKAQSLASGYGTFGLVSTSTIISGTNSSSTILSGLNTNYNYIFSVSAIYSNGTSTPATAYTSPYNIYATNITDTSITLNWTNNISLSLTNNCNLVYESSNIQDMPAYIAPHYGFSSPQTCNSATSSYTFNGLNGGTQYYFSIRNNPTYFYGNYSVVYSTTTKPTGWTASHSAPAPRISPSSITNVADTYLTINWTSPTVIDYASGLFYTLNDTSTSSNIGLGSSIGLNSYTLPSGTLAGSTSYTVKLYAYNGYGNSSPLIFTATTTLQAMGTLVNGSSQTSSFSFYYSSNKVCSSGSCHPSYGTDFGAPIYNLTNPGSNPTGTGEDILVNTSGVIDSIYFPGRGVTYSLVNPSTVTINSITYEKFTTGNQLTN